MPGPIEQVSTNLAVNKTDAVGEGKVSDQFDQVRKAGEVGDADGLPPLKEVDATENRRLEHDLRQRIDTAKTTDPAELFNGDVKEARKRLDHLTRKVDAVPAGKESSGIGNRLRAIEAQFAASEKTLKNIPNTSNLRDLLVMQTEMYKMSQNIEVLSKVVDAATSGIKNTLQMQV